MFNKLFRAKGTLRRWTTTRNAIGGNVPQEVENWERLMHVEPRSGTNVLAAQQKIWTYDYKVEMRHYPEQPTKNGDTIDYRGQRLTINSIEIREEGNRKKEICRCSAVELATDPS
jgi:SPP1 family predicted phage head-tail adaptor